MHSPGRFDGVLGLGLMIPAAIAAVTLDALPVQVLFDPRVVGEVIIGAIFIGGRGLLTEGIESLPQSLFFSGLAILSLLYYIGVIVILLSVATLVRNT